MQKKGDNIYIFKIRTEELREDNRRQNEERILRWVWTWDYGHEEERNAASEGKKLLSMT
jgi:hypothetical protein